LNDSLPLNANKKKLLVGNHLLAVGKRHDELASGNGGADAIDADTGLFPRLAEA
jgi:hypothetical protein